MSDIRHQADPFTEAQKAMPLGEQIFEVMVPGLRALRVLDQRWVDVIEVGEGLMPGATVENTYEGIDQLREEELIALESLIAEAEHKHVPDTERKHMPAKILELVAREQRVRIQNRWREVYEEPLTKPSPLVEVSAATDDGGWAATFSVDRAGSKGGFSGNFSPKVAIRGRLTNVSIGNQGMLVVRAGEITINDRPQAIARAEINYVFRGKDQEFLPVLDVRELDPRDTGPSTQAGTAALSEAA